MAKFIVFKSSESHYRFRLVADNGEPVIRSEGYTTRESCMEGIEAVRRFSQSTSSFMRRRSSNGQYYFFLRAANGEIIGDSELYTSSHNAERGIRAVMREAPAAPVEIVSMTASR
jgi:uncharacterized protein